MTRPHPAPRDREKSDGRPITGQVIGRGQERPSAFTASPRYGAKEPLGSLHLLLPKVRQVFRTFRHMEQFT